MHVIILVNLFGSKAIVMSEYSTLFKLWVYNLPGEEFLSISFARVWFSLLTVGCITEK